MNTEVFQQFFAYCVGSWQTERTYHYLADQEVERSRTEFLIQPLTREIKQKVLTDNNYPDIADLESIPGFNLGFYTISEKGEEVRQNLNHYQRVINDHQLYSQCFRRFNYFNQSRPANSQNY